VGDINRSNSNRNSRIIHAENFIRLAQQLAKLPHIVVVFLEYVGF